ncbi:MAG: hypothetical protein E7647_02030 [Ruminococcaceae bacterium]|nr:hypothetical protein [Oscillospiraceae bacterium]
MRRIICILLCICTVFLSFASCSTLSSSAEERKTVLTVGEYEVPYELYYYVTNNLRKDLPEADEKTIEAEAFEMIREIYAVFSLAEDFGIDGDDKYIASIVDDAVKLAIEECGGKKEYKEALAEIHMNDSVFRLLKRHSQTAEELLSAIINSGKYPTDENALKNLVSGDEFIRVKQILIMSESSVSSADDTFYSTGEEHTDEEALEIAERVREKALAGEDFDSLVNEFGESLYMFNNTDGYYVCRGMWEKENEDAVFALEVGEISEVIKSPSGYSVFLRCDKSDSYIDSKIEDIADDYYKAQYNLLLKERIEKLTVEKTDAFEKAEK